MLSAVLRLLLCSFVLTSSLAPIFACHCHPPTLPETYFRTATANYVRARVLRVGEPTHFGHSGIRRYVLQIQQMYKGCPRGKIIVVRTQAVGPACGILLEKGASYVLPLTKEKSPFINRCTVSISTF